MAEDQRQPAEKDAGWLRREFERARKRRAELPAWARPVPVRKTRVTPFGKTQVSETETTREASDDGD